MNTAPILPHVLVVDDSQTQGLVVRQRLVRSGFSAETASSGEAALAAIARRRPDVVLTDLMMPQMDGFELVGRIKQEFPGLPVVLMTAHGTEDIALRALRDGAAGYVAKRNLERDLARTLENVLALVRASSARLQLRQCLAETNSCYLLDNDTSLVAPLVGKLQQQLEAQGLFDDNVLLRVSMALREALINAIEHGNLEASSALRERDDDSYIQLVRSRRHEQPYCSRRVMLCARETRDEVTYVIRDDGPGFDVSQLPDPTDPENLQKASGRGILLIRAFMDEVSHNANGNEITMIKRRRD